MSDEIKYPHVPAAFINAIREEGTKAEACDFLQLEWNKSCAQVAEIARLTAALAKVAAERDAIHAVTVEAQNFIAHYDLLRAEAKFRSASRYLRADGYALIRAIASEAGPAEEGVQ